MSQHITHTHSRACHCIREVSQSFCSGASTKAEGRALHLRSQGLQPFSISFVFSLFAINSYWHFKLWFDSWAAAGQVQDKRSCHAMCQERLLPFPLCALIWMCVPIRAAGEVLSCLQTNGSPWYEQHEPSEYKESSTEDACALRSCPQTWWESNPLATRGSCGDKYHWHRKKIR